MKIHRFNSHDAVNTMLMGMRTNSFLNSTPVLNWKSVIQLNYCQLTTDLAITVTNTL